MNPIDKLPRLERPKGIKRPHPIWLSKREERTHKLAARLLLPETNTRWPGCRRHEDMNGAPGRSAKDLPLLLSLALLVTPIRVLGPRHVPIATIERVLVDDLIRGIADR
ncbi:MAG: hypothetical protein ACE5E4_13440 [Candidatus Binatia bacterium]